MLNLRNSCKNRILIDFLESFTKESKEEFILIIDEYSKDVWDTNVLINELLEKNIYGIEYLKNNRIEKNNLSAIYLIDSKEESIDMVINDFKISNKYKSCNLFFLKELKKNLLVKISNEDNLCGYISSIKEINCSILPFNEDVYELKTLESYFKNNCYIENTNSLNTLLSLFKFSSIEIFYQNCKSINESMDIIKSRLDKFQSNNHKNNIHLLLLKREFDLFTPLCHDYHYQALINDVLETDFHKHELEGSKVIKYKCNENDPLMFKYKYIPMKDVFSKLDKDFKDYIEKIKNLKNEDEIDYEKLNNIITNLLSKDEIENSIKINYKYAKDASNTYKNDNINELLEIEQELLGYSETDEKKAIKKAIKYLSKIDSSKKLRLSLLIKGLFTKSLTSKNITKLEEQLPNKDKLKFINFSKSENIVDSALINKYSKINNKNDNIMNSASPIQIIIREILSNKINKNLKTHYYPENSSKFSITKTNNNNFALNNVLKQKGTEKSIFIIHIFGGMTLTEVREIKNLESEFKNIRFICGSEKIINSKNFIEKYGAKTIDEELNLVI